MTISMPRACLRPPLASTACILLVAGLIAAAAYATGHAWSFFRMIFRLAIVHAVLGLGLALFLDRVPTAQGVMRFLVAFGLACWVAFWVYWWRPGLGPLWTYTLLLGAAAALWRIRRTLRPQVRLAHGLLLPTTAYAAFILVIGYYPSFEVNDLLTQGATRWLDLPGDNILPKLFADQLRSGQVSRPMVGDWLSSDRPPLQTGAYLLLFGFSPGPLSYQVAASWLQALVLLPALLLLRQAAPRVAGMALIALGASSLLSVHVLFVWPKLLAAAYGLVVLMLAMDAGRVTRERAFLLGAAAALAMLSHGGAVFSLLAIALCMMGARFNQARQLAPVAAATAFLAYAPWLAYQRFVDPPGNRLLKWHLAGVVEPNELSLSEALATTYAGMGWPHWLASRLQNLERLFGGSGALWTDLARVFAAPSGDARLRIIEHVQLAGFFELSYSLWAFAPVPVVLAWLLLGGWRRDWPDSARWLLGTGMLSAFIAALLLFSPEGAVLHQVSLLSWITLFAFGVVLLQSLSPAAFGVAVAIQLAVFIGAYLFAGGKAGNPASGLAYAVLASGHLALFALACLGLRGKSGSHPLQVLADEAVPDRDPTGRSQDKSPKAMSPSPMSTTHRQ
jgi:hypothetical protein